MDIEMLESKSEQHEERDDRDGSFSREHWHGGAMDDLEQNGTDKSGKRRSKDRKKINRGEEKEHRTKEWERTRRSGDDVSNEREKEVEDMEKDRISGRERRKDDRDEREKDRGRDKKVRERDYEREKYRDKDRKDRSKEKDREKEREGEEGDRGRDKDRGKEKNRDRDIERDRVKEKEREREKHKDRAKGRESYKDLDKEKGKENIKDKEREAGQDKERTRERVSRRSPDDHYDLGKDGRKDNTKRDDQDNREEDVGRQAEVSNYSEVEQNAEGIARQMVPSASELGQRILKIKEERLKKNSECVPDVLAWVNRSRKIEEKKNAEKEKALQLSKIFEEQDNIVQGESDDEEADQQSTHGLAGIKVLHGVDKVMEGGAVVLTLKDQNILADGDINAEVDMLENVEIGEQKLRDEAYKAAKKKTGIYSDKFNDDPASEKKMLSQYDDPSIDEVVTLDGKGRIAGAAEKKLEELRRRLQGASTNNQIEDLSFTTKVSSDYFTPEEMLQFKKPKKKKSLRKKEKLDLDALEAEAVSAGLGTGDLGSRHDVRRQAIKEQQERAEAEKRNNAYQSAYAKADEASKSLRLEQTLPVKLEEDENPVIADDDDELYKSLERARKVALKNKEEEAPSGPQAVAILATTTSSSQTGNDQVLITGESQENKVVFTEMEEFVWGLQLDEEAHNPDREDVFMNDVEDEKPRVSEVERKDEAGGGWTEVNDDDKDGHLSNEEKEEIVPDETIHEVPVGKGLAGVMKLLKERGTLKETVEWGGRNMDKRKSKLIGIVDDDDLKETRAAHRKMEHKDTRSSSSGHQKETHPAKSYTEKDIHIERTDEYGRILTPKEAFRQLSHKFHGKGPGKMKQEKRMKQYQEELKLKQMSSTDTPSLSVERMRDTQAQLKTPYLVLSGHVKPGQTSDPRSGFATVEKDLPGGLTPMLGDKKVEHFLGIKRKAEPSSLGPTKKLK